jgi:hypothetical protein
MAWPRAEAAAEETRADVSPAGPTWLRPRGAGPGRLAHSMQVAAAEAPASGGISSVWYADGDKPTAAELTTARSLLDRGAGRSAHRRLLSDEIAGAPADRRGGDGAARCR